MHLEPTESVINKIYGPGGTLWQGLESLGTGARFSKKTPANVTPSRAQLFRQTANIRPPLIKAPKGPTPPSYSPVGPDGNKLPLPKGPHGQLAPSSEYPHSQIGWYEGRKGGYVQTLEFGPDGKPIKRIDWTDHGRPKEHTNPHCHDYLPNPTGGNHIQGPARPLTPVERGE